MHNIINILKSELAGRIWADSKIDEFLKFGSTVQKLFNVNGSSFYMVLMK